MNGKIENLNELYQTVGELKGTMDSMDKKLDATIINHEDRINVLETETASINGRATGIGIAAGFAGSIIGGILAWIGLRK